MLSIIYKIQMFKLSRVTWDFLGSYARPRITIW